MRTCNYNMQPDIMPLMMNFTAPSPIEEISEPVKFYYDDFEQINYDMRVVGTRSLKASWTHPKKGVSKTDRKNEIDDSKTVR